ncbi:MAG: coproporphyrinogen-III oxidase family protein [Candidatus Omnitrophota bacterium]|jgi:oxygen-independent coproporphyrinogen-3 oxidase
MTGSELIKNAKEIIKNFKKLQKTGLINLSGDFFPSVHYPPITMYPPISEEELFEGYRLPRDSLLDIYVHIPFCLQQCVFCHYPVKTGDIYKEKDHYIDMLKKEIDNYMRRLGLSVIKPRSILFGGGTPTFLSPEQLKRSLDHFASRVDLGACTQFSYDVDPSTLLGVDGQERLKIMRSYGVHRLTIGMQSLDDAILKKMNRPHNSREAIDSVAQARREGFKINIEFIYGYPGQTFESWVETIQKAIALETEEIQIYRLKVIPYGDHAGSIKEQFARSPVEFIAAEDAVIMKQIAIMMFHENGYNENLRRVFTKKREDFSHYADNQCCKLFDQIGFGLTAFSSMRDRFGLNTQSFAEYYALIEEGKLPVNRGLVRTKDDQLRWCLILPLKNREVYKAVYEKQTGMSLENIFRRKIERLKKFGLLYEDDKVLRLTELGSFFSDEVCEQFHHPDYMPFPKSAYAAGELCPYDDWEPTP